MYHEEKGEMAKSSKISIASQHTPVEGHHIHSVDISHTA